MRTLHIYFTFIVVLLFTTSSFAQNNDTLPKKKKNGWFQAEYNYVSFLNFGTILGGWYFPDLNNIDKQVVSLKLKDGQEVTGTLAKENAEELVITTSDAEPLVIPVSRIAKRENMPSSMPPMGSLLSKREIRDVVEFLSGLK